MNFPTIAISIFIAVLFFAAVRYMIRRGTCSCCTEKSSDSGCSGKCAGCGRCCHAEAEEKHKD